jgi:hypothetical protein
VTNGLPGATLIWSVAYFKRGQAGHATWGSTKPADLLGNNARDVVDRLWTEAFGLRPGFVPAPKGDQRYDTFVQRRRDQMQADIRL